MLLYMTYILKENFRKQVKMMFCSLLDFLLVNVSYVTTSKFPIGIRGFCLRSPSFSPNMTLLNFHPPYIGLVLLHNSHHLSNSYEVPDLVLTNVPTFAFF